MPDLITLDFETYYAKGYGFRTHTTEEYVRDERFEEICCERDVKRVVVRPEGAMFRAIAWTQNDPAIGVLLALRHEAQEEE